MSQMHLTSPTCPCCGVRFPDALTPRMARAYAALLDLMERSGGVISPSYPELTERLGLASRGDAHGVIADLEVRGWVRVRRGAPRGITPLWPLPAELRDD